LYNPLKCFTGPPAIFAIGENMCVSCGCGKPNDNHGNSDLITMDELQRAAKAANESVEDAAKNIAESVGLRCK